MAKSPPYSIVINDASFDLASSMPLPVDGMTGTEMAETYNKIAGVAATIPDFDPKKTTPVGKFPNKEAGIKRIAALHSSVVAFVAGIAAEKNRKAEERAAKKGEKAAKPVKEPKEPKAKKEKAANGAGRGRRSPLRDEMVITKLVDENPKRAGSQQHIYWEALKDGMTVGKYRKAIGVKEATVRLSFDIKRELVSVSEPTDVI